MIKLEARTFAKKLGKMVGSESGLRSLERIALRLSNKTGLSIEDAAEVVSAGYKAILMEFKQEGVLRLPYGILVRPRSKLTDKMKKKFLCSNWSFDIADLPTEFKKDPPFTLFHSSIITALMALEIEDELWLTYGITPEDLAKKCIYGIT